MLWVCRVCVALTIAGCCAGCPAHNDTSALPESTSSGSDVSASQTSEATTTGSTSTGFIETSSNTSDSATGSNPDPESACGAFEDWESCPYEVADGIYCNWVVITPVSIEDEMCVLGDPDGACVPVVGGSTALGCSWTVGCDGPPYQIDLDGQLGAFFQCGGSPPIGSSPCTYVEPGVFEPAACGCICDGVNGGSSSGTTGGTGTSSSTGM